MSRIINVLKERGIRGVLEDALSLIALIVIVGCFYAGVLSNI